MKQAVRRKYHYIYKITRVDSSGKFYIGMHSTDDLGDGYFGSGTLLAKSIKKHGKDKHVKEILEHLPTREALKLREKELVNEELLGNKKCMNLKLGGEGGQTSEVARKCWTRPEVRARHKAALKKKFDSDEAYRKSQTAHSSDTMKSTHQAGKIKYDTFTGRKHSEQSKQKMRDSRNLRHANQLSKQVMPL